MHYQIGAPSLIYREKVPKDSEAFLQISGHEYPRHRSRDIAEHIQRKNRLAIRWNFATGDLPPIKEQKRKRKKNARHANVSLSSSTDQLQEQRRRIALHHQIHVDSHNRRMLETYASHDQPRQLLNNIQRPRGEKEDRAAKLGIDHKTLGRSIALQRYATEDPAYLAPFGLEALNETKDEVLGGDFVVDKSKRDCFGASRPWQGNCLICVPCPCPNCQTGERSWCIFHPTGLLMDTLCVSNIMLPNSKENAGHFFPLETWQEMRYDIRQNTVAACKASNPNELCLEDIILEVKQSGKWSPEYPHGTFVVRTSCYISIIRVSLCKPDWLSTHRPNMRKSQLYGDEVCWGNYVLKEERRIDLRTLVFDDPSYRPVSLACHPKYGNEFTDPNFAFVSLAEHRNEQNVIHHSNGDAPMMHTISSLRHISLIDYSNVHPMCLWSAASSYVRPTLVPEIWFKKQYPLGFGTSLYTIDLRFKSSIFQWSPSAQGMKQEGTHSINALYNDWGREHALWVSSRSAGKTWELDSRMPCQPVHTWSLGCGADSDSPFFAGSGPYGDAVLLTKPQECPSGFSDGSDDDVILRVDTTPTTFGFQTLQRPLHKPRFQTDSLECTVAPHGALSAEHQASIATTSVFALPERGSEVYTCGFASFRTSINKFISNNDESDSTLPKPFASTDPLLCTLTMNNHGDIFCHSLLEVSRPVPECRPVPGLPVGTAVIPTPVGVQGKTHPSEHKSWKPTGGRNIKVFWTNQYPTSRYASALHPSTIVKAVPHPRKKVKHHVSTKLGKGSGGRYDITIPHDSGGSLQLAAPCSSKLIRTEASLMIPKRVAQKALENRLSFSAAGTLMQQVQNQVVAQPSNLVKDEASQLDQEDDSLPRSDLHEKILKTVSRTWDLWNQLDAESSSDEEGHGSTPAFGSLSVEL